MAAKKRAVVATKKTPRPVAKKARAKVAKTAAIGKTRPKAPSRDPNSISPKIAAVISDLQALRDTIRDGVPLEERFTVHHVKLDLKPGIYAPTAIVQVRQMLGASQPVFATFLGVDVATVRSWEQGLRAPSGMARRFLDEIMGDPEYWKQRLKACVKVK
jgi:putative transcriptional regulator